MRYLLSVIILLTTFCSCTRQTNPPKDISQTWSEAQKRKFFEDSIAFRMYNGNSHYSVNGKQIVADNSLNDFEDFIDSLYPEIKAVNKHLPFIYAFEEPYIDTSHIETSKKWFRMILDDYSGDTDPPFRAMLTPLWVQFFKEHRDDAILLLFS